MSLHTFQFQHDKTAAVNRDKKKKICRLPQHKILKGKIDKNLAFKRGEK